MKPSFRQTQLMALSLFTVVATLALVTATNHLKEIYQQKEGLGNNLTRVHLWSTRNHLECFRACQRDSGCLGIAIQGTNGGNCFKISNDTVGDLPFQDELLFIKCMYI